MMTFDLIGHDMTALTVDTLTARIHNQHSEVELVLPMVLSKYYPII